MENIENLTKNISKMPDSYLNSFRKRIYSTILQSEGEKPEDWFCYFIETMGKNKI